MHLGKLPKAAVFSSSFGAGVIIQTGLMAKGAVLGLIQAHFPEESDPLADCLGDSACERPGGLVITLANLYGSNRPVSEGR
jgi:hypothetical protein